MLMTIRSEPAAAAGFPANGVEHALAAAIKDGTRVHELLDELCHSRLWIPLPADGGPVTDGHALTLPTVRYLDAEFVPAFTSLRQFSQVVPGTEVPHAVVHAVDLARLLPAGLGIALNPGAAASVPIYPADVTYLASTQADVGGSWIRVGHPPEEPSRLLSAVATGLRTVARAESATRAWLIAEGGQGLVISVTLDDPCDGVAQQAVLGAVEDAVALAGPRFPVDVTFPGECEPGPIEEWAAANALPFYLRT
jgi:SseB protein N-terminal domain/SseB protein C-terminal domain